MAPKESLGILEVLDNLNAIVEAASLEEIEVTDNFNFVQHKPEETREFLWVRAGPNNLTMEAVRENFRAALKYLHSIYQKVKSDEERKRIIDGVDAIMVLVGEASSKLERFDIIFKDKIPKLTEYKNLQNFYKRITVREQAPVEEEVLEEFLPEEGRVEEVEGVHLLNDIESVKRDHLYELFYLQNEAGLDFYTEALARNMKVSCDFGQFAKEEASDDPLVQIKNWEDKGLQLLAKRILSSVKADLESYYKEASEYKEIEVVALFQRAIFALMLAANPRNLIRQFASKGCYQYFSDFLSFLRELLVHREFVRFVLYRSPHAAPFFSEMVKVVYKLVFLLYTTGPDRKEISDVLGELAGHVGEKEVKLSAYLKRSYEAIKKLLEKHPNGPLFKALDLLREESKPPFDPLMLGNIPEEVASCFGDDRYISFLRIPSPIIQEKIEKAIVSDEFRTLLSELNERGKKLLYIDFQDRTSWLEHSREQAIEALSKEAQYQGVFSYVNLAKETDFYNQMALYRDLSDASEFIRQFHLHLSDESTGYYFSPLLRKELFPNFMERLLGKIWTEFFDKKPELPFHERTTFIDLAYHFIALKIIELEKPDFVTLTSKDGLDSSAVSMVGFLSLIKLQSKEKWKTFDKEEMRTILFAPTLLQRERLIHSDRFIRLIETLQLLEDHEGFSKAFSQLFEKQTMEMKILSLLSHSKE